MDQPIDGGQIVADQQMILVEPGDGRFEFKISPCDPELLDQIGGSGEQDPPAVFDQGSTQRGGKMAFAAAARAGHDGVGACSEPAGAGGERHDRALLTMGTASNSTVASVLPGGTQSSLGS